MKKILISAIITLCLLMTSCASSSSFDTYFIHAAAFEMAEDEYKVYVLCEKTGEKDKYFTASAKGNSIENAATKIMKKYTDCYFATCEIYFFNENTENSLIQHTATEICDSNIFPSKSSIIGISGTDSHEFMKKIKNEDDLKKIKNESRSKSINSVKFFASAISGKNIKIPAFTIDGNKKIKKSDSIVFSASKEVSK